VWKENVIEDGSYLWQKEELVVPLSHKPIDAAKIKEAKDNLRNKQ
jgi:hypothetical protein